MNRYLYKYSFFYNVMKCVVEVYLRVEKNINELYQESATCKVFNKAVYPIKIAFYNSLIGRLTQSKETQAVYILGSSWVTHRLLLYWEIVSEKITISVAQSWFRNHVYDMSGPFKNAPLKIGGLVLMISITTNSTLILFFDQDATLLGWIIRGILLLLGFAGLFSDIELEELKKRSLFLNKPIP